MALKDSDWKRFFYDPTLEVQGTGALRRTENGETLEIKPQIGNNGRKFIYVNGRKTTVDYLVASCFCHREPGQKYIRHKDGDVTNDNFKNLEWTDCNPALDNEYNDEN